MADFKAKPDVAALEARICELEDQICELEMRRDLAQGAVEILGKVWGGDSVNAHSNREKAELISSLRPKWPLLDLLASAGMARSSYHYQIRASSAPDRDAEARSFPKARLD